MKDFNTFKVFTQPKPFRDMSKLTTGYPIARLVLHGADLHEIYISREPYFVKSNCTYVVISKWNYLKDLFDIVNLRTINLDDLENSISEPQYIRTGEYFLRDISSIINQFKWVGKYVSH